MWGQKGGGHSFDMFIKSIRHPVGNVQQAPGYSYLKFRGEVLAGDSHSGVISISQILDFLTGKPQRALDTDCRGKVRILTVQ